MVMNHVCALDLTDDELDLVVDALYQFQSTIRRTRPRSAQNAHALRRRFMLLRVTQDGESAWGMAYPGLPPEST